MPCPGIVPSPTTSSTMTKYVVLHLVMQGRMERLGVGRRRCPNGNEHHYLHALSPQNLSPIPQRNLNLSFLRSNAPICVTSCRGLLCFDAMDGCTVVCNLTTQQLKFLPPRPCPRGLARKNVIAFGFGYDATCDDYKVIRLYRVFFYILLEDGTREYNGSCLPKFELYSLRLNSWREIPVPEPWPMINASSGRAYVNGSVYWISTCDCDDDVWKILAFDFATETFTWLDLPRHPPEAACNLVNIDDDTFGVVIYAREGVWKLFELWMWRQGCWTPLYNGVFFYDVEEPLGLKYGRLLFLGRKITSCCGQLGQLLVYDWITKELKELDIYDYSLSSMQIISYVESRVALPNAMPIGYYNDEASWDEYWRRYEDEVNQLAGV